MKATLYVVKVGGKIVEDNTSLNKLLDDFASLTGYKVLIHGGGRSATRIAEKLGIESKMVNGRRITDAQTLDVVTMVYGGLVNKNIVAGLQARGINALGLTGADCNVLTAHKRPVKEIDYGFVGDVDTANGEILSHFIAKGIVPVMAPLTHDGKGNMLNTNADTIAAETAKALAAYFDVKLMYCFEFPGVLSDAENPASLIPEIRFSDFEKLVANGTVSGGMIPKLENAFDALDKGVGEVIITQATAIDGEKGTHILP